jgi:GNAT superfamily N-acetyltransferase
MTELQVRAADRADAGDLATVYRSAYAENERLGFPASAGSATAAEVAGWIREQQVLVAEADGEVVGGVRVEETGPDRTMVSRLGVRDDRQGEAIGSRLLDRAEAWARDLGCERVWLTTPPEHPRLPEVYRSRGYQATGPYPLANRDYDEVVLEKSLE